MDGRFKHGVSAGQKTLQLTALSPLWRAQVQFLASTSVHFQSPGTSAPEGTLTPERTSDSEGTEVPHFWLLKRTIDPQSYALINMPKHTNTHF